ncbi:M1-specific T cell receptor beta chain-like [Eucyclogobius newberryi]|uniref:M1-specific T cell receptor beta chain-like n=1 Tax=Eucyclogobius newberryi TaxID=166745 RepID=UPI003B5ACDB0
MIMELSIILIAFKIILASGSSTNVHQTPSEIVIEMEQPSEIKCSHSIQDYNCILWYKQSKYSTQLQLLGYMFMKDGYPEKGVDVEMKGGALKDQTCILTLPKNNESAKYYCAASSTVSQRGRPHDKNIDSDSVSLNEHKVFQSPPDVFFKPGSELKLTLSHQSTKYDTILWYQRLNGDTALKLLGYMYYKIPNAEDAFTEAFSVSGDGERAAHLHISNLTTSDCGVYFGAARQATQSQEQRKRITKTSQMIPNAVKCIIFKCCGVINWHSRLRSIRGHFDITLELCANYEAYFGQGTKLTVLESDHAVTPPEVQVFVPSESERPRRREDPKAKTLVCVARGFYPDHVTVFWKVNGLDRTQGVSTDSAAQRKEKHYSISSRLRVKATDWNNPENCFNCTVQFYDGTGYKDYTDGVCGIKEKEEEEGGLTSLTREEYLKVTQTAKLSYVVFIVKGVVYGLFVAFLVWRIQRLNGKQT